MSDSILLAVSGGIDSMAMLHLFKEAGYTIGVAHCNFQLRGEASEIDEALVRDECKKMEVPFFVRKFDTQHYADENGLSIQIAARELRYTWFNELLKDNSYDVVATGHHFGDTMETIILNLTRGTSTEGFTGIPVKNKNIIRPLLNATREQIAKYIQEKRIPWREDESNLTDDYQRNYIRHHIIPKLKEINPSLESTWQNTIEKIEGDLELLNRGFETWKEKFVVERGERVLISKEGLRRGSASELWRLIRSFGFNFEQTKDIVHSIDGQSGKRFFSDSHLLVVDRHEVIVTTVPQQLIDVQIEPGDREVLLGPWKMSFSLDNDTIHGTDKMCASLDADAVAFPLTWRKWRNGDFFRPLGMRHKKKLSDFFIDNKLSLADKEMATVLESNGEIVYVVGWRIDERFKIKDTTKRVLNIQVIRV
jgi:tRNA(Ile)-lysidine synthase